MAALAYIFPMALILGIYEWINPNYFLRYHAAHALLVNVLSALFFLVLIALAMIVPLQPQAVWPLGLHMVLGIGFSVLVLLAFILHLYCIAQAYLGRYTVLPGITSRIYVWLEWWGR